MAQHDPSVAARYAPVMNLLAADIGSSGSTLFPDRRNFDPYTGHSWASGTSPFADGNNQESVSESVNAYGLGLWAGVATGDAALQTEADWMLSLETASSTAYWTNPDLSQPEFAGYATPSACSTGAASGTMRPGSRRRPLRSWGSWCSRQPVVDVSRR